MDRSDLRFCVGLLLDVNVGAQPIVVTTLPGTQLLLRC